MDDLDKSFYLSIALIAALAIFISIYCDYKVYTVTKMHPELSFFEVWTMVIK